MQGPVVLSRDHHDVSGTDRYGRQAFLYTSAKLYHSAVHSERPLILRMAQSFVQASGVLWNLFLACSCMDLQNA